MNSNTVEYLKINFSATIDKMVAEKLIFKIGAGSATEYKMK